jgi:hypothetical protein
MVTIATAGTARTQAFYVWIAATCVIVAFGSFAETYWLQLHAGTFIGSPLVHMHAALFSAWPLFFLLQTGLAASGRIERHQALGLLGIALATAMVFAGMAVAIDTMTRGLAAGYGDRSRAFIILPISAISVFAIFFAAAIANVRRPEWHKRFMIVATASLLQAPIARVFFVLATGGGPGLRPGLGAPPEVATAFPGGVIVSLLLVAGMLYDWRTRGRPHTAYIVGAVVLIGTAALRIPLSHTPAWYGFADFLANFTH